MTPTAIIPRPLGLTDDELVALAAVSGRAWPIALRSVDTSSEEDMRVASARGLRSLAVRSLITESGTPSDDLSVVLSCLGARPRATIALVDDRDRVAAESALLLLFQLDDDRAVVCRSDVSGTHLLHELDTPHAVELMAEQLGPGGGHDTAAAFRRPDGTAQGGLRRRAGRCHVVDGEGNELDELAPLGGGEDPVLDAVRRFWHGA